MKAYMSDASERRTRDIDADQLDKAWGEMAVREARAILAAVEAEADYVETLRTLASDRGRDIAWDERSDAGDAARALADALAAFVAD